MTAEPTEPITAATCLTCGACCVSPTDSRAFADVEPSDIERLGKKKHLVLYPSPLEWLVATLVEHAAPLAMRTRKHAVRAGPLRGAKLCVCAALNGDPMRKVSCTVYETRPRVCRESVSPGDRACRIFRARLRPHAGCVETS